MNDEEVSPFPHNKKLRGLKSFPGDSASLDRHYLTDPARKSIEVKKIFSRNSSQEGFKVKSKNIINRQVFSDVLEDDFNPSTKENASLGKQPFDFIPRFSEAWEKDLQRRIQDLKKYHVQTVFQKIALFFKKPLVRSSIASGEEIAKYYPGPYTAKLVLALKKDPLDTKIRLQLISLIRENDRAFPLEAYRLLFLQALLCCSLGELSSNALQQTILCQDSYLRKLLKQLKERLSFLEKQLEQYEGNHPQFESILNDSSQTRRCIDLAEAYQRQVSRSVLERRSKLPLSILLEDFKRFARGERRSHREQKTVLFKSLSELLISLRHVHLLHPLGHQYIDLLVEGDPEGQLPSFLKGRLWVSDLNFLVSHYLAGERQSEKIKKIQSSFKHAYHYYGIAVSKLGPVARSELEYTVILEYANLVHYFYRVTHNLLGIYPPKSWMSTIFAKALKALALAQESDKVRSLTGKIHADLEAEGLNN